jgi:choline monooxygenase
MEREMPVEGLPADWYVDPEIARRERAAIFGRNWLLFGPAAGLEAAGNFRTAEINGWPLFVMRGEDRELRCFHNVCRHRGAMLLAGEGPCKAISCPYHGWTYDLAGRLLLTPGFGADSTFDRAAFGLLPLRAASWQGLIFVCSDPAAPDLVAWLGDLPGLCAEFPLAPQMEYFGSYVIEGAANWKTYCDNTVEGYHLPMVHPRLVRAVAASDLRIAAYDEGRLVVFEVTYKSADRDLRGAKGLWFYRFPGFQGVAGATGFKAERIEALGPGRLKSSSWQWFRDLGPAAREEAFAWSQQIVREDLSVCEGVQRNMAAGAFSSGLLSPGQERHTVQFQALVREAVSREVDDRPVLGRKHNDAEVESVECRR